MRVAMIGAGGIAWKHLSVLEKEDGVEVVAHVARSEASANRAARRWGGRAYTDLRRMLDTEQLDAAWVTVPPHVHGEIERVLIRREIPMFVEKPLSADRGTAHRVAKWLDATSLVAAVGYQWRALDTIPELRERLARHDVAMIQGAWQGTLPPPRWWRRQSQSGGQMVEQATHLLDLARHLLGEGRVLHSAAGSFSRSDASDSDVAGAAAATLVYDRGALGSFTATSLLARTDFVGLRFVCNGLLATLTQERATFDYGDREIVLRTRADQYAAVDLAFLEAVRSQEPSMVHCSYSDALRTHDLVFDVQDASLSSPQLS